MKILTISLFALLASTALVVDAMAGIDDGITNHGVMEGTITSAILPPEKTSGSLVSAKSIFSGPVLVTFNVVNKHTAAISTSTLTRQVDRRPSLGTSGRERWLHMRLPHLSFLETGAAMLPSTTRFTAPMAKFP
ncbi:hypothetical protein VP1G_08942 [Cytospora mali]|uniref:Uncharacterized protein n=1 Tax=Cytospora mali TaxID=578113 RepID=A0A194VCS5_CYTMA|nr:hypothetical protein VP1G_08942 [Valsa mali var. pyri (nom. inval.)]